MKKKIVLISIAALMVVATMIGGTMAAFQASTSTQNDISTSELGIDLIQETPKNTNNTRVPEKMDNGEDEKSGFQYAGMPGDIVDERVYAKNSKDKTLYLRVTVNKSWVDQYGEKNFDADANEIKIITNNTEDWFIQEGDEYGEVIYYYYKKPLKAGEETTNLMDQFSILAESKQKAGNTYTHLASMITFEAEAIQETAAKQAMLAEWGIKPTFESDGILTMITEQ